MLSFFGFGQQPQQPQTQQPQSQQPNNKKPQSQQTNNKKNNRLVLSQQTSQQQSQTQTQTQTYSSNNSQIRTFTKDTLPNGIKQKLIGVHGNQSLELYLPIGAEIVNNPGSLLYMRGNLQKSKLKINSVVSSIWRKLSGETFTLSEYKGLPKSSNGRSDGASDRTHSEIYDGGYITLGLPFIGDIVCVEIPKGKSLNFTKGAFLCATSNLEITGNVDFQQIIPVGTDQLFVGLLHHKDDSTGPGYVWLSTYGTFETITLQKGDEIIIDNGMFLGSDSTYEYTISRIGVSLFGSILGGEGWGMHFRAEKGPMTLYTQTKSIKELIFLIRALSGSRRGGSKKNLIEGGKKIKKSKSKSKSKSSKKTKKKN